MDDIFSVLNAIGYTQLSDSGDRWRTNPLYRDFRSQGNLSIRKSTGEWYDHSERAGGGLATLIKRTLSLPSEEEAQVYLKDLPPGTLTKDAIELVEVKKFDKILLTKLIKDNSYWNSRGISDCVLEKFHGGVSQNGRMKNRYTFPIFDRNEDIVGFAGRSLDANNGTKWKLIGKKSQWVFPLVSLDKIAETKTVFLVESIGNLLSLWQIGIRNALVLFGCQLSSQITHSLLRCDVSKIILLLDNDTGKGETGNVAAKTIQSTLEKHFDAHQIVNATPTLKDLNEMLVKSPDELRDFCSRLSTTPTPEGIGACNTSKPLEDLHTIGELTFTCP